VHTNSISSFIGLKHCLALAFSQCNFSQQLQELDHSILEDQTADTLALFSLFLDGIDNNTIPLSNGMESKECPKVGKKYFDMIELCRCTHDIAKVANPLPHLLLPSPPPILPSSQAY
jgi:hypothetical protein